MKFTKHATRQRATQTTKHICEGASWFVTAYTDLPSTSSMFIQAGFLPSHIRTFQLELASKQANDVDNLIQTDSDRIALQETAFFYAGLSIKSIRYNDDPTEYDVIQCPPNAPAGSQERIDAEKAIPAERNWVWLDDLPFELILALYNQVFSSEVDKASDLSGFPEEQRLAS